MKMAQGQNKKSANKASSKNATTKGKGAPYVSEMHESPQDKSKREFYQAVEKEYERRTQLSISEQIKEIVVNYCDDDEDEQKHIECIDALKKVRDSLISFVENNIKESELQLKARVDLINSKK